ncbi:putative folate/pteridine transporter [Trypanosoma rangeli]|uniref:Putative folate/pteridine transporter n=1 Tax=Trypanosoma rangeli TaxID=5698 RepID=A0A422NXQ0_TRYRA|nr:putative folate/pteridine transporter [Trypanosoma rangeli]RNF10211.1 putative folate/pteridine transporter [Trypanosoma rangeli]|eukprot:RNF10211.1 putative folate/pteridine transporter [Trypanosoma rangeli]
MQHIGVYISVVLQWTTTVFSVFNGSEERPNRVERLEDHRAAQEVLLKAQDDAPEVGMVRTELVEAGKVVGLDANTALYDASEGLEGELSVSTCHFGAVGVNKKSLAKAKGSLPTRF